MPRSDVAPGVRRDTDGRVIRTARAAATDDWLRRLWRSAICEPLAVSGSAAVTDGAPPPVGVALAAVGSHARREAGPHSDLDLVLLVDDAPHDDRFVADLAERIWYPVWDAGRRLDHSVRSVADCRGVAADDLPALVGLLDLRVIDGDAALVDRTRSLVARDWRAAARGRLAEIVGSVRARHARFGDLAALTDPDLKECRGGIRDMAVLRAMTAAWLADRPHGQVDEAYRVLLDTRDALHEVTGRGRDRLARQDAPAVAEALGLSGPPELTERLAESSRVLAGALETTIRRAEQAQRARRPRGGPRTPRLTSVGFGVYRHEEEIVVGGRPVRDRDPLLALRVAVVAGRLGMLPSPASVELLARLPVPAAPWDATARGLFAELLGTGAGLLGVWEAMTGAGLVGKWLPCWESARGVPQVSALHRHTVDRHQLEAVVHCAPLLVDVARPDLLLVAALLHDIGKPGADGQPHAERGVPIAVAAATGLGFDAADAATIGLLVRGHLRLAELATTRDPQDPATVEELLAAVDSRPDVLELLRALTLADARATGGAAWSSSRRAAIEALAGTARRLLARRLPPPVPLPGPVTPPAGLRETVAQQGPSVLVEPSVAACGAATVWTLAPDRLGLFADLAALLAAAGLQVRSAELSTTEGLAHDRWEVAAPDGARPDPVVLTRRLRRLEAGDRGVLRGLAARRVTVDRLDWLTAPGGMADRGPGAEAATVAQVRAPDAPGMLHAIGTAFARAGVDVRRAEIATLAGRCLDTFALTTADGAPLGPAERTAVERALGAVNSTDRRQPRSTLG